MRPITRFMPCKAVTSGPNQHFFGYYDKSPWSSTGQYLLAMQSSFSDRPPLSDDIATIGLIDLWDKNQFIPITRTLAWNWQQGAMLQWLPNPAERLIIYNDRQGNDFVSVIYDIHNGPVRVLPMPVYAVSHDGCQALTLNFARLAYARPGYGYAKPGYQWSNDRNPKEDGIYWMDLRTGECRLIISLFDLSNYKIRPDMAGAVHWFNHLQFSPDDRRFIFLHRWSLELGGDRATRLFTAKPDGTGMYLLADDDMTSHFDWRDPGHILAWARRKGLHDWRNIANVKCFLRGRGTDYFFLFEDLTPKAVTIGKRLLTCDGHCSYSPDRRWVLTDTYPDRNNNRSLLLFRERDGLKVEIGRFYSPPVTREEIRCDLHPRWDRAGTQVCIDSSHEGSRQMYIIDVEDVVNR